MIQPQSGVFQVLERHNTATSTEKHCYINAQFIVRN